jgi:hypothetical protein
MFSAPARYLTINLLLTLVSTVHHFRSFVVETVMCTLKQAFYRDFIKTKMLSVGEQRDLAASATRVSLYFKRWLLRAHQMNA